MKPFQSKGKKKETVGSLLTRIFIHCGVPLDDAEMDDLIVYMDAAHLTSAQWLKEDRDWCFRDENSTHLVSLRLRTLTEFDHGLASIQFCPDPRLLHAPATIPRRYKVQRPGGPQLHQPEAALPPFPPMPDMSTRPEGDFQRVVVDALTAEYRDVAVRGRGTCQPAHHLQQDHHASAEAPLATTPLMRTSPHNSIPIYLCFLLPLYY